MEEAILERLRTQSWGVFKICAKCSHRSLSPYEEALHLRDKHPKYYALSLSWRAKDFGLDWPETQDAPQ